MTTETTTSSSSEIDILAALDTLESETIISTDILAIETIATENSSYEDILSICEKIKTAAVSPWKKLREKVQFLGYYITVSCIVFTVLLVATNYSAYSALLSDYIDPSKLKAASQDIAQTLTQSKIEVYADEQESKVTEEENQAKEERIKKQLEEENITVKDVFLSPKKLIPTSSDMIVNVEIVPYENRIIIPKLGKNIPLVDVPNKSNLSFENLEDVFMSELEKGVLRYPGTSRPGEEGNAFIFGHSSNYPWMKWDYNDVFALLDKLVFGDEIIVYYNQQKFVYVIREKKVVKPGNVSVMKREDGKKELSLMTCWPVGTTLNRLLVFAELKKD